MELAIRLSHSFPPDYKENNKYLAQVHSIIKKHKLQISSEDLTYRPVESVEDLRELKLLHEEWFPINYPDTFFSKLQINNRYKSILAVYQFAHEEETYDLIVGCITFKYNYLEHDIARFSFSDLCTDRYGIYILTFGVINEIRKQGLATILLNKIFELAVQNYQVKYIYLDVVSYNDQGIKCYERNGFHKINVKKKHYNINNNDYDAFVYCKFVNDGKKARSVGEIICQCVTLCGIPEAIYHKTKVTISRTLESRRRSLKYKELKV